MKKILATLAGGLLIGAAAASYATLPPPTSEEKAAAAAKAANMRVAAIPDQRFVNPREYEKKADYVLGSLKELTALVRKLVVAK